MLTQLFQKFGFGLRQTIPVLTTLLFIILGILSWPIPYVGSITPSIGLASIYYWSMYRPDLMRTYMVFLLGLLSDALNYMPLGLTALVFVAVHQLSFSQRRFFVGQFFPMLWSGFALVALLAAFVQWLFLSLINDYQMSVAPVFIQTLLTIILFPLPAWVLNKIQKTFLTGDHHVP